MTGKVTGTFAGITIGAAMGKRTGTFSGVPTGSVTGAEVTIATGDPIGEIGTTGDALGVAIGAFVIIPIII